MCVLISAPFSVALREEVELDMLDEWESRPADAASWPGVETEMASWSRRIGTLTSRIDCKE